MRLGVEPGDRVAIYLPMCPEVAVASHACAHIGAIQMPLFSGFAAPAVTQRLQDSEAKVVITADYSLRRGHRLPMRETVEEAVEQAPSVEHIVTWERDSGWGAIVEDSPGELPPLEVGSSTRTSSPTPRARPASRRASCTSRAASSSPSPARSPTRRTRTPTTSSTSPRTWAGSWGRGRWWARERSAAGSSSPRAPDKPADRLWRLVESERVSILGLSPTLVRALIPHGDPTADPPPSGSWSRRASPGTRIPTAGSSRRSEAGAARSSTARAGPRSARASSRPRRRSRSRSARWAGLPWGWRWTSSTPRGVPSSTRARWASSCASGRFPA